MRLEICPICAAVAGTWLLLTALVLSGYLNPEIFLPLITLLMGGTVVGVAYQIGKRKPVVISVGMLLAFWAVRILSFKVFILEIAVLAMLAYLLFVKRNGGDKPALPQDSKTRELLEEKMKNCC
ncbi:MAG: hypothetical protein UW81_C0021G0018 [Candidatus Giovannonibacteria bacterium GW2011_GWC2_44_9]|uniref:Uncharacterized protein n=1 Tax=Candidatus Giovannonibacteria bacterium GW2011_GWC2_44_9 TaxID=1618658 RepID=A0A0G1NGI3_9BACT|nr:MAG: hypothetical protein UW81_C0021G0018 [Candidatus Giovannonibacteria bacterium GW2011_GWC2_44_9]